MIAHSVFFYIFSLIAIVSAVMVTVSKNTVHSVFFLILDFISISCLFIMIGAEFLGLIMLIGYVGAVAKCHREDKFQPQPHHRTTQSFGIELTFTVANVREAVAQTYLKN